MYSLGAYDPDQSNETVQVRLVGLQGCQRRRRMGPACHVSGVQAAWRSCHPVLTRSDCGCRHAGRA